MSTEIRLPDGHPVELASEDDREWFDAHPDRILRFRRATDGDPGAEPGDVVFVFCPVTGSRFRFAFTVVPDMRDALMAADTDKPLAPYFAIFLEELVTDDDERIEHHGSRPSGTMHARRLRKLFNIAREHGRLLALPSTDVLDAA